MALRIPQSVNYPSPLVALPTRIQDAAPEGPQFVPCEIDWGGMGGPANCVFFNMQNNATLNFSQIVALKVDNSQSGADVQFIFPDTSDTVTIPAGSPSTITPCFTNQTQFYVLAPGARAEDVTRFSLQNSMPPPISVAGGIEQENIAAGNIGLDGVTTTQLVELGVSGTLEAVQLYVTSAGVTDNFHYILTLEDGNAPPRVLAITQVDGNTGETMSAIVLNITGAALRFQNGVRLVQTLTLGTGQQGFVSANIAYRTP